MEYWFQAFEVLWEMSPLEVEEVMSKLKDKSLVRIEEDPGEGAFTYAIHDLYLNFLKKRCPSLKVSICPFLLSLPFLILILCIITFLI